MNSDKFKYDFMRYNRYFVLRANILLFLILCYLCKDIFLIMGVGATAFKSKGGDVSDIMVLVSPIFFISDLPALAVTYALSARQPNAGIFPRRIWKNGRFLLSLSACLHLFLLGLKIKWELDVMGWIQWLVVVIDIAIVIYINSSEFIKDLFSEFPNRENKTELG